MSSNNNMTPFKQRQQSMSFEDSDTDMMEDSSESITSPPRSARGRKARLGSNFAAATPKSRRLFDTGDDDGGEDTSPLEGYVRTTVRTLKPLNCNNLNDSSESSLSSSSVQEGGGGGRKRSSAERRRDRTPSRMGMDEGSGAADDASASNNNMYASPRISPNSFVTLDGRFVQSKNPFSSPMMTDTPTVATHAVMQAAPSLPETFYGSLSAKDDEDGSAKMPPSILPPRHHHQLHLQPKGTPATQAAARLNAFSLAANGGYPDQRYGFTGSPIPEHAKAPPPPPLQMESTDAASAGSLHKVRRINLTDDVVSATGHHLTNMSRRPPGLNTISSSMMCLEDGEDGISPTDVVNFPSFTPAPKGAPPPTPIKQRPSKQPYSSIRSTSARTPGQPPVLTRKTGAAAGGGLLKTPAFGCYDGASDDEWTTSMTNAAAATKSRFHSDFDVIGELGKGSFGTVYKVLSRLDGCMYAIKEAHRQAKGAADRDRMLKEVYALAALSDQADTANFHIVRYHQAWMEDDRLYIQTELCSGTLGDEVARGQLTPQRRYKLLRELLLALDFIHRNNMVHLDIKPENVFLKNDQYKLGDFGLVTKVSASQDVEEGDSRYMSMELLSGDNSDLTKSDIFSLGATMYEICLGRSLPHNGQEWQDIRAGRLAPLPNSTDVEMASIIQRMMDPVAANRPTPLTLLKHPQLLSNEQKALNAEKTKVFQANIQLAAQQQLFQHGAPPPPKRALTRANTWSGGSLPYL